MSIKKLLDIHLDDFHEHQILAVTSKVVSLCEGRVVPIEGNILDNLLEQEVDLFLPRNSNPYGFGISIKNDTLISNGGIDESNGNGYFVLWPKDPQASANSIRAYVCDRFRLKEVGVIITDSHVLPLRWGSVGTVIGFSGFLPLKNYIGQSDIFGRTLKVTRGGIAESLAAAAVVCATPDRGRPRRRRSGCAPSPARRRPRTRRAPPSPRHPIPPRL